MANINQETKIQQQMQLHTNLVCSVKKLGKINKHSVAEGLNRNLYFGKFRKAFKAGMCDRGYEGHVNDMIVILQPLMLHKHKRGVECDAHVRCLICTDSICDTLVIDVTADDWFDLIRWNILHGYAAQMLEAKMMGDAA